MTDPTFDTLEALDDWATNKEVEVVCYWMCGAYGSVEYNNRMGNIARVRAAHSHLLKGKDDG